MRLFVLPATWSPLSAACIGNRSGSTAVEFALLIVPFFALIFAILETALALLAGELLQSAVADASRSMMVGKVKSDDRPAFKAKICERLPGFFDCDTDLAVDVRTLKSLDNVGRADPYANGVYDPSRWGYNAGSAGSVVIVTAAYPWPTFIRFGGFDLSDGDTGQRILVGTSIFKNEKF